MTGCQDCGPEFDGTDPSYRRVMAAVIGINLAMFTVEIGASFLAGSKALQADALDFLGDAATYGLSLFVIGKSLATRSAAAMVKGGTLAVLAVWVLGSSLYRFFAPGMPEAGVMSAFGLLALTANLTSALLLYRFRQGDANVRSAWLCTRNDAIGNLGVILAAGGVWATNRAWPDLTVAVLMASLFLYSAVRIMHQARTEWRHAHAVPE